MFGFSKNLGSVSKSAVNTLFTIGLTQENAVQLLGDGANGTLTTYKSLWTDYFKSSVDAVSKYSNSMLRAAVIANKP